MAQKFFINTLLGDGFWNAEHEPDGAFTTRRILVPDHPVQIDDQVLTWTSGPNKSITFDLWTPDDSPVGEEIFIQFNPYGWTTPLPMTELGPNHWVFILYSPFDILSDLSYRYCREGECGRADDAKTAGTSPSGRTVTPGAESQYIADSVENWIWLDQGITIETIPLPSIPSRGSGFMTAVEIMPGDKPTDTIQITEALPIIARINPGWVILTPTWSFTSQVPPVIEPDPNQDPLWFDLTEMSSSAKSSGLRIAINPQAHFPESTADWWTSAPLDFSWWNSWFDQYHNYAVHFAQAAEQQGAEVLVLGGDWVAPALPGGRLPNGDPSGVPADSELRWQAILTDVKSYFSGRIGWSMTLSAQNHLPGSLDLVDQVYLNWMPEFEIGESELLEDLINQANTSLEGEVNEFWTNYLRGNDQELILSLAYPSVRNWSPSCLEEVVDPCISLSALSVPAPDIPELEVDFALQAKIYTALISTAANKSWISGIVSEGYYAPAILHDKSISIHGKPAQEVLSQWFAGLK